MAYVLRRVGQAILVLALAYTAAYLLLAALPGDAIIVETAEYWYVYTVTDSAVVAPSEVEVIAPVPGNPGAEPTDAMITLTTCHPLWSTAERFVVHGRLDYWAPHDAGTPAELEVS